MSIAKTALIEEIQGTVSGFNVVKLGKFCRELGIDDNARVFSDEDSQKIRIKAGTATAPTSQAKPNPAQGDGGSLVKAREGIAAMVQQRAGDVAIIQQQVIAGRSKAAAQAAKVIAQEMGRAAFETDLTVYLAQELSHQSQEGLDLGIASAFDGFTIEGVTSALPPGDED